MSGLSFDKTDHNALTVYQFYHLHHINSAFLSQEKFTAQQFFNQQENGK